MRTDIWLLFGLCLTVSPTLAHSADRGEVSDIIDQAFGTLLHEHEVPGLAVGVTIDGKHHFFNYGVASLETREPVTEQTIFEIGSVSKTFTATLGGYAMATGRLSLGDTPSRHAEELTGSGLDRATLLHLATYTAGGLPLQFPESIKGDEEALSYLASWTPEAQPGTARRYSNPSIGLFGYLTARALEGEFVDLLQLHIVSALGLTHTFVDVPREAMTDYAWGYDKNNRPIRGSPGAFDDEAYGVKSSAADMIAFIEANLYPERLDPTLRRSIKATHTGYFQVGEMVQGLGWEQFPFPLTLDQLRSGNSRTMAFESNPATPVINDIGSVEPLLFSKTGSTNGFGAYAAFIPDEDLGVVMLANKNIFMPARLEAMHQALDALSRLERKSDAHP